MKKNAKSFLNGKGFYVALSLSVAMVGAACYFAYTQTSNDLTGELQSALSSSESDREAAEIQTDIPKHTQPPHTQIPTESVSEAADDDESEENIESVPEENNENNDQHEQTAKPEEKKFSMPIEGEILNEFSNRELVKSKTTGAWQTHNGIDISAALGDVVLSSSSGTVSAIDNDPLWGIMVTIDHGNGIITRYCNLNEGITVQVGQKVGVGEEIGAVGETADIETSEKSHLHFEAAKNGSFIDPLEIIG